MNIFVAKLNYNTSEDEVRTLFEGYGEVDSVKIITDRDTGRSKGFGFVEMPNDEEGHNAINGLNEQEIDGYNIVVKKARPKEERDNRGGGGYRGGGGGYNRGGGGGGYGGGGRDRKSWDKPRNNDY